MSSRKSASIWLVIPATTFLATLAACAVGSPSLSTREMGSIRGGSGERGKCEVTCSQYQPIAESNGNWSCATDGDGATCNYCDRSGLITYADQDCDGSNYTDSMTATNCGNMINAKCLDHVCSDQPFNSNLTCEKPKAPVTQDENPPGGGD